MRLASIRLHNWLRFRGEHSLDLEPLVYGVVAQWSEDPERSNWGGKSALLAAVRFALFGTHPADTEDEWLTRGESQGGVILVLDTGERVERSRIRGKATRLRLDVPPAELRGEDWRQLHGDEAQAEVERRVGLGDKDFGATVFFEQKRFAEFVVARPGRRMEIVRAWLDLDPLYGARDRVAAALRQLLRDEEKAAGRVAAEQERERGVLATVAGSRERLPERRSAAEERAEAARRRISVLERQGEEVAARRRDAADLARWEEIGRELEGGGEDEAPAVDLGRLRRSQASAQVAEAEASRLATQARQLAAGAFDGACPLLAGLACPATGEINGDRERSRAAAEGAYATLATAREGLSRCSGEVREAEARANAEARRRGRLEALAAEQKRLAPAAERARRWLGAAPEADGSSELGQLRLDERAARREADDIERAIGEFAVLDRRRAEAGAEQERVRAEIVARQEALAVLALARRTIADGALEAIAARANGLLCDAGIGLSLKVSWMREIPGQLAAACEGCGSPFPSSQRVKECQACGATRGPKLAEELELRVSARSGAADDLAGLVFCLAAGAWLRDRRGSEWSVAFLDEPFGALDLTHRRLLAAHLQAMLASRHGFSQAFVVAHEAGIMDGLPGRLLVSAGPEASAVEVAQ